MALGEIADGEAAAEQVLWQLSRHIVMHPLRWYSVGICALTLSAAAVAWVIRARRAKPDREQLRRAWLSRSGRLTTGTTLDLHDAMDEKQQQIMLLSYQYHVSGVAYEASQDITRLQEVIDFETWRVGQAATVRYDPHNPGNSIVISETWNGLRSQVR